MSYKVILFTALIVLYSASSYSQSFRISPQLLNKLVDSKKVVVLDVRTKPKYDLGHIKNAISFPVELTYENKKINGKVQQPRQMQKYLRERGVDINSTIIVYDGGVLIDAARVFGL